MPQIAKAHPAGFMAIAPLSLIELRVVPVIYYENAAKKMQPKKEATFATCMIVWFTSVINTIARFK